MAAPAAHAALGISVSTPTVALSLEPGQTATGTGAVVVTPGLGPWQLSIADSTSHAGHLAKGGACPSYADAQTSNALTVRATGPLSTSAGTKTVSGSAQLIASGSLLDTLTMTFDLAVAANEHLPTGCTYSTTLTYTLQ